MSVIKPASHPGLRLPLVPTPISRVGGRLDLDIILAVFERTISSAPAGPPLHVHDKENEAYYALEGEFEFVCGSDAVRGGPDNFLFAPRGIPHRIRNSKLACRLDAVHRSWLSYPALSWRLLVP
jgi:mannose-6-phosphate isomerase-like protein (cupin superfamily)